MSESSSKKRSREDVVDTDKANKLIWLVKVPRYLSEIWEKNAGTDVGTLKAIGDDEVSFISTTPEETKAETKAPQPSSSAAQPQAGMNGRNSYRNLPDPGDLRPLGKPQSKEVTVPREHKFKFTRLDQSLGILLEDKTALREDADLKSGKISVEGCVVKRAEIQPPATKEYMLMKRSMIYKASQPTNMVKKVDRAVHTFKPRANQQEILQKQKAKKDMGIKSARGDQSVVTDQVFKAFERHQYYKLNDLAKVMNQPPAFIREILTNIAIYNSGPPHKNTWELKPEYKS